MLFFDKLWKWNFVPSIIIFAFNLATRGAHSKKPANEDAGLSRIDFCSCRSFSIDRASQMNNKARIEEDSLFITRNKSEKK